MLHPGLISIVSNFSVRETIDRLVAMVQSKGLTVFARVDHAANATAVDMPLRPTELLIFGNPRGGTPLMQDQQTAGLDLPFKALAWEDEDGKVWLTYNDPVWLARRHGLSSASDSVIQAIAAGMNQLSEGAVRR